MKYAVLGARISVACRHISQSALQKFKPRSLRVPSKMPVFIEHGGARFSGVAVNLGLGGLFVEASPGLPYGEHLELVVQLPGLPAPSRLPGVVRWSSGSGFGVQFQQLGARETHAIGAMVAAYRKAEALARELGPAGSRNAPSQPP